MDKITIEAPAKINLSIDILRKRPDEYHEVEMIMQTISLYDVISLEIIDAGIEIECDKKYIPQGERNIAYKAAKLLLDKYSLCKGIKIIIEKNIPIAAGLAGGSTDAAAVLKGMNYLFKLNINSKELSALGKQIGADVPFCINGGTMLAKGIGEELSSLNTLNKFFVVLVKPDIRVSTKWVYQSLNLNDIKLRPNTNLIIDAISKNDIKKLAGNMTNVLENVTERKYPIIAQIKKDLLDYGAHGSIMSGSGPSVFGIFTDFNVAKHAFDTLRRNKSFECFLVNNL